MRHLKTVAAFMALFLAGAAPAAIRTVTSDADSGAGTLREAIASATPGDTIVFDHDMTIVLASSLTLDRNLTIDASGRLVAVDGNDAVRLFDVNTAVAAQVIHLTLQNGNVTAGNGFGAAFSNNYGALDLRDCTLSNNAAYGGGAIYNLGTLTVTGSTLSGNSAVNSGGAIYNTIGTLALVNSTLSGNSAVEAGGIVNVGSATLTNSTLAGNSAMFGGKDVEGTLSVTLVNTIVADGCAGTISDGGGNLDGGASCGLAPGSSNANLQLGSLQDNGGPTLTVLPGPGSAAIDAIACTNAPAADQRGVARPQGGACDVGAVEVVPTQCGGVVSASTAFSDDFPGSTLSPANWTVYDHAGTVSVAGNSVSLGEGASGYFPYVVSVGQPIPPGGAFSVRWRAAYTDIGDLGDGTLVLAAGLPTDGTEEDAATTSLKAWQDSGGGYRLDVLESVSLPPATIYSETPPPFVEHDVEYCWLADATQVWLDSQLIYSQPRDPGVPRPNALWFGNPRGGLFAFGWNSFTLYGVDVYGLVTDEIFGDGFDSAP